MGKEASFVGVGFCVEEYVVACVLRVIVVVVVIAVVVVFEVAIVLVRVGGVVS